MFARSLFAPVHRVSWVLASLAVVAAPQRSAAQVVGENVNIVSGTQWPGGDPYLQRQNEPSIAVSSVNPLHVLAGANDYRTVDLPNPNSPDETGDAWLGLYKSFDGGQTWQSLLLPGYPQDTSADGVASPLHANSAAADPVIRAGSYGMFYYSGITFNRGTNIGQVFVARLIDLNNKENGDATQGADPIKYIDAHQVAAGGNYFVDKPWLAVDKPRLLSGTCTIPANPAKGIPAQSFKGGTLYLVWTEIFNATNEPVTVSSNIMFSKSTDCGATWSTPIQLNDASSTLNQGASVALDPITGFIYVTWRRYANAAGTQTDAVMVARSFRGFLFTKPRVLASIIPSDQDGTASTFRAEGFPTIAISVDAAGKNSWAHIAWPQRAPTCSYQPAGGFCDGQIAISTALVYAAPLSGLESDDDCHGWSTPAPADATPIVDDFGNSFVRGHQFMPQLTFSQGQLMLLYYDSHLDHTRAYYQPNSPFQLNAGGKYYAEQRAPLGELQNAGGQAQVFNAFQNANGQYYLIDESNLTSQRHTLDVRLAQAAPGPKPVFVSTRVTNFRFGERGDETVGMTVPGFSGQIPVVDQNGNLQFLQELQANPPNLPMFAQGTVPFIGDYIDIQGPAFVLNSSGTWTFNYAPVSAPVFHAVWTSNQDVRPPPNGNWALYTPPGGGGQSVFDPTQTTPACITGYEGTRNQNVYTSRITNGLVVASPQNVKPLSPTLTRAFVIAAQNQTANDRYFRFTATPPSGVTASFRNDGVSLLSFDVTIPAHSTVYRSLFATSSTVAATIPVTVTEVNPNSPANCLGAIPPKCAIISGGLAGSVTLNPPGSNPSLVQPDGSAQNINTVEVYAPQLGSTDSVVNTNLSNTNLSNTNLSNTNLSNTNFSNTNFSNTNLSNTNFSNTNFSNTNLSNASVSDASYVVSNTGNTTTSYHVQVVGNAGPNPLQLIISKNYTVPLALNCQLVDEPRPVVTAAISNINSAIIPFGSSVASPNIPDPSATNATVALAPGESAVITLRGVLTVPQMAQLTSQLTPVVVPHAGGTYAAALVIQSDGTTLGAPQVGVPYTQQLVAIGGTAPYTWSLAAGSLPPGITLSSNQLAGTPTQPGSYAFTLQVNDSATGQVTKPVTLVVSQGPTSTTISSSASSSPFGGLVTLAATVSPQASGPTPTGQVTFKDGGTTLAVVALAGGGATLAIPNSALGIGPLSVGTHSFTASYSGDANYTASTSAAAVSETVSQATTTVAVSSSAAPSVYGQSVTFTAAVGVAAGSGAVTAPTGTVSFVADGATSLGTATLGAGGTASVSTSSLGVGSHSVVATYSGDTDFVGSSAAYVQSVSQGSTTVAISVSPSGAVFGQAITFNVTVTAAAPSAGIPTGSVQITDGGQTFATVALDASGKGTANTSSLTAGSHTIGAVYGGDANFAKGNGAVTYSVSQAATSLAAQTSGTPSVYGQAVTFTATLSVTAPGKGTPTGTIQFVDSATSNVLGTTTLTAGNLVATVSTASLAPGSHTITASYSGDSSFLSTSTALAQVVNKASTSTVLAGLAPLLYGQKATFSATVSAASPGAGTPTGTVNFFDGSTLLGSGTLSGGVASFGPLTLGAGSHSITATYTGDSNFAASSPSAAQAEVVSQVAAATAVSSSANPSTFGNAVSFTATVGGVAGGLAPTGAVQFTDGSAIIGTGTLAGGSATLTTGALLGGTHSIAANYLGDANYLAGTSPLLSEVVNPATPSGTVSVSPNPSTYGQGVTIAVTVAGNSVATPTGTVQFVVDGATVASASLASNGTASYATTALGGGSHVISVVYSGDANYAGLNLVASKQTVNGAATTTTLTSSANPIYEKTALTFSAVVSSAVGTPSGTVTFLNGTATLGAAALDSTGKATFTTSSLQEGTYSITAAYGGSSNFAASTSAVLTQKVLEQYTCKGFFSPLATAGSKSSPSKSGAQKYGSTVGVKWQLVKPDGTYENRASANLSVQAIYDAGCAGSPASGAAVVNLYAAATGAAKGTSYSYSTSTNQHVLSWTTSNSPSKGCYDIVYTPDNGTAQLVTILQLN
ncbi:MAG TPA: Ig-like domain repeat protein [Anaeromyxobacteraceae bacterium]|nr:Ig-like domain repeat protein [Anaeromyxobacteraceae bacterium]